jgi:hypothetical protein
MHNGTVCTRLRTRVTANLGITIFTFHEPVVVTVYVRIIFGIIYMACHQSRASKE